MDDWELTFREKSNRRAHLRDYRALAGYSLGGLALMALVWLAISAVNALI